MKNKKQNALLFIMFLGILTLIVLRIIPSFKGIMLSMKDYSIFQGFEASPWIGFKNFKNLFSSYHFIHAIKNTILTNAITMLFTVVLSGLMVYGILNAKTKKQSLVFTAIYALPALMPPIIKASFFTMSLGINIINFYYIVFPLTQATVWAGYAAIGAFFLQSGKSNINKKRNFVLVIAIALLAIFSRLLSSNTEFAMMFINPIILDKANVIDFLSYRSSFMMMEIGMGSAIWVFKLITEFVFTSLAVLVLIVLFKRLAPIDVQNKPSEKRSSNILNYILCSIILIASFHSLIPKKEVILSIERLNIPINLIFLFGSLIVSIISSALAATLSYPFASKNKVIRTIYLIVVVFSSYGVFHLQRFLNYRSLGLINTILPVLLNGFLPMWMIVAYAIFINRPKIDKLKNTNSYIKDIMPLSIVFAAINFAIMWGGYLPSLIYTQSSNLFTIPLMQYSLLAQGSENLILNVLLLIPIIIVWTSAILLCNVIMSNKEEMPIT